MDVEITVDAVHHAPDYQAAIFLTGDSDFYNLIRYLKTRGKQIFIMSCRSSVSKELRTGADGYTDMVGLQDVWGSQLKQRRKK